MSVSGISGSSLLPSYNPVTVQNKFQKFQQEFQQLGQDLQSGNLTQAQSDFATLQQNAPAGSPLSASASSSATSTASSSISQAFNQLFQDLQSGNLSAAQSDFAAIQQDAQQNAAQGTQGHHHHHHHHAADSSQGSSSSGPGSAVSQAFSQLSHSLQSGNLQSAQQAYASLQQDFQKFAALGAGSSSSSSNSSTAAQSGVNVTA
jgi:hypothetical protein